MQVGTPLEVYEQPENIFVATFIGTPPMNFFKARIAGGGKQPRIGATPTSLPVPEVWRGAAHAADGREILVGIRPENLLDAGAPGRGATAPLSFDVEVVEPLGHEVLVHGRLGDDLLVRQGRSAPHPEGRRVPSTSSPSSTTSISSTPKPNAG